LVIEVADVAGGGAADEVECQPVGVAVRADVNGQLPLSAELKIQRQARDQRRHRIRDVLAGYPLPCAGQRVPGLLPHQRQVHHIDAVLHPARTSHVLAFHPGSRRAPLFLPGLIQRADDQAAPPAVAARRFGQAGRGEPADLAHRRQRVP
jgi:hypothetical protein